MRQFNLLNARLFPSGTSPSGNDIELLALKLTSDRPPRLRSFKMRS